MVVVSFMLYLLYPREGARGTHGIERWVGPVASLDVVAKRNISRPCMESNPGCPASSLITILTELPGFPLYALQIKYCDEGLFGHLMIMFQQLKLYTIKWDGKVTMNGEQDMIWKDEVTAYFKVLSHHLPEETE
jgi:hypothetical protein